MKSFFLLWLLSNVMIFISFYLILCYKTFIQQTLWRADVVSLQLATEVLKYKCILRNFSNNNVLTDKILPRLTAWDSIDSSRSISFCVIKLSLNRLCGALMWILYSAPQKVFKYKYITRNFCYINVLRCHDSSSFDCVGIYW